MPLQAPGQFWSLSAQSDREFGVNRHQPRHPDLRHFGLDPDHAGFEVNCGRLRLTLQAGIGHLRFLQLGVGQPGGRYAYSALRLQPGNFADLTFSVRFLARREFFSDAPPVISARNAINDLPRGVREFCLRLSARRRQYPQPLLMISGTEGSLCCSWGSQIAHPCFQDESPLSPNQSCRISQPQTKSALQSNRGHSCGTYGARQS